MSAPVPRFTIGRLMAAVAVSAEIFALFRMTNGTGPVGIMLLLPLISVSALLPVRSAQPGRWLLVATWVAALWPLSIVAMIHATYGIATSALGRPPTYADQGQMLRFLRSMVVASLYGSLAATLIGLFLPLGARNRSTAKTPRWNPQTIPVLLIAPLWLLAYKLSLLDPTFVSWLGD